MKYELQLKLNSNPLYLKYLHENSYWYKLLLRNPNSFKEFENEMLSAYKLRFTDKLDTTLDNLNLITNLINNML